MTKAAFRNLAICTLIAVVAAAWAIQRDWSQWGANENGTKVFPDLAASLDEVAQIKIRHRDAVITLERSPEGWILLESDRFPANSKPIQELLFALSETRKLEPKTEQPDLYARLQLEEPTAPKSKAKGIDVLNKNGETLASLILGKENLLLQTIGEGGAYLRIPGEEQTWLASGDLIASEEFQSWLDNPIMDIPRQRFDRAEISHPNGDTLVVTRSPDRKGTFVLDDLGEGEELINEFYPTDIARVFEVFEVHDARKDGNFDFPTNDAITGTYRTIDGLTLKFELATVNDEDWIRFGSVTTEGQQSAEAIAEAEAISKISKGWTFRIPEFESVHLKKDRAQVTKSTEKQS